MNSLAIRIRSVNFTIDEIVLDLLDGRKVSAPLAWYPTLMHATPRERKHWRTCAAGSGLHWPDLDYHLSAHGILHGCPEGACAVETAALA